MDGRLLDIRRSEVQSDVSPSSLVLFVYPLLQSFFGVLRLGLMALVFQVLLASDLAVGIYSGRVHVVEVGVMAMAVSCKSCNIFEMHSTGKASTKAGTKAGTFLIWVA